MISYFSLILPIRRILLLLSLVVFVTLVIFFEDLNRIVLEISIENRNKLISSTELQLKTRNTQWYYNRLKKRGQYIELPNGGIELKSFVHSKLSIPSKLKHKNINDWTKDEQIWINLTYYPWWKDNECGDIGISFNRARNFSYGALASFPGSGNTWIRYLIEISTGYFTGSMYADHSLMNEGFYGEFVPFNSGLTQLIKTHGFTTGNCSKQSRQQQIQCNHFELMKEKPILLIRNPFDCIISHRNLDSSGHVGMADRSQFQGKDWNQFVVDKIHSWKNFYLDYLNNYPILKIVNYDDLKNDNENTIKSILEFLDYKIDDKRMGCLMKYNHGSFERSLSKKTNIKEFYDKEEIYLIDESIKMMNKILLLKGVSKLKTSMDL